MSIANRLYFAWLLAVVALIGVAFVPETSSYLFKPLQAKWLWLQVVCLGFQAVVLGVGAFQNWGWTLRYSLPLSLIGCIMGLVSLATGLYPTVMGVPASAILLLVFGVLSVLQFGQTDHPEPIPTHPALGLAALTAVVATLASLYYSEVKHFIPCTLCWYQRVFMYPLAFLLPAGVMFKNAKAQTLSLFLTFPGILIATYHVMEEKIPGFNPIQVCAPDNPCTTPWVNYFGFITIPVMSLTAFLIITVCVFVANRQQKKA